MGRRVGRVRSLPSGVLGTELWDVTTERGHCHYGVRLLLCIDEGAETQRLPEFTQLIGGSSRSPASSCRSNITGVPQRSSVQNVLQ